MSNIFDISAARERGAMSYQEKNTWAFGVIAVLGYAAYVAVVLSRAAGGIADVAYAGPMLASIGAGIVLGATSRDRGVRDERERDIERMGEHVGQAFLVLGGVTGLVLA